MKYQDCTDTISTPSFPERETYTWSAWFRAGLGLLENEAVKFTGLLFIWQERATQRRALLSLDDRLLKDVGISRAEAKGEAAKPFWRP